MKLEHNALSTLLKGFPVLHWPEQEHNVNYFSLNPFLPTQQNRCPLDCGYCVCHQDGQWHHHPEQFTDTEVPEDLVNQLLDQIFTAADGISGFPISFCDYSDPLLPVHQHRLLTTIRALIARDATNMLYITTKFHPGRAFLEALRATLDTPHHLRPTVFVSLAPLKPGYERVSVEKRIELIQDLVRLGIPCCWYLRPLTAEWFDEAQLWSLARQLLPFVAEHTILSGVTMSAAIETSLTEHHLLVPTWEQAHAGVKQEMVPELEQRVRTILREVARELGLTLGPVMAHRVCGVQGNNGYACVRNRTPCHFFAPEVQEHGVGAAKQPGTQAYQCNDKCGG